MALYLLIAPSHLLLPSLSGLQMHNIIPCFSLSLSHLLDLDAQQTRGQGWRWSCRCPVLQSRAALCNEVKTYTKSNMELRAKYMAAHSVHPKQQTGPCYVLPVKSLHSHFILSLTILSIALRAIGSTLGAATGLFRARGMSTLHSLSEWRLTTCGSPTTPRPSTNNHHLAWSPSPCETHAQQHARERTGCTDV